MHIEPIDNAMNADIMSDMKPFTVRDLDRRPAEVLDACDAEGEARIRRRDGRTYLIRAEPPPGRVMGTLPDFAARRKRLFPKPLPQSFADELDRAMRNE